ncbi:Hsp70 family protein [Paenibacillaceae bacterium WGS1546]|uniref:Hsp70 family protein n=1 Tax=Cohnella sp. WGS1546 TaxID=3366810 RepID=UPI00372CF723
MANSFIPVVGIDLGTTNSSVAHIRGGKPDIIASPKGERIIPSVVLIDTKGKVTVGEDAKSALVAMPDHTIAAVKRRMGSELPIRLAGSEYRAPEISALILKELKTYVDELYGEGEKEAVITVPAYFTDEQRRATKEAGELAGFIVERIINEPTAAALAFGLEHLDEDRHLLVYDLGGGTFDVSVVEMMDGIMEVRASTGDRLLGGEDFDWRLVDWMAEQMIKEHGVDPRDDLRGKALLKETAEQVKIELSAADRATISLPLVTVKDGHPIGLTLDLTRQQFVALVDDLLLRTMDSVRSVLDDAELAAGEIDEILLVGGSTRIPRVHELIREFFGREPRTDVHPDEAVALGAAVQAGLKSGALSESGLIATDVAPYSMGIAVLSEGRAGRPKPGYFSRIIPRNTTIPVTRTERYHTTYPGQTAVSIEIYQGEHDWVKNNSLLGEFLLEGLPESGKELEAIDVTFRYNLNGILEVSAKSVSLGAEMTVTVQDALERDSRQAFEESATKLEKMWLGATEEEDDEDFYEWLDDEDDSLEDIDVKLEEPSAVLEETARLRERAEKLLESAEGGDRQKLHAILEQVDDIIRLADSEDDERIQERINEIVDLLIDLEVG